VQHMHLQREGANRSCKGRAEQFSRPCRKEKPRWRGA
jgi:hypothetical protein